MAHRRFKTFRIGEISGVDSPAQKGAKALIMKRDLSADGGTVLLYVAKAAGAADLPPAVEEYLKRTFTADERKTRADNGHALPDGSFPIDNRGDLENAIRAIGRAKDPGKAKSHIIARARALDATSLLPSDWGAAKSIGGDLIQEINRVAPRVLPDLLDNVAKAEEIEAQIKKLADAKVRTSKLKELEIAKGALVASAWSVVDTASPEDMASLLQKNFVQYKDHVAGLVPTDEGDAIMLKAIAKSLGLSEDATEAQVIAEINKRDGIAKADAKLAKMSGKHKAFMENDKAKMPSGGKEAFQDMSPSERDAHMSANPCGGEKDDDEADTEKNCIKVDGQTIRKRDVGAATFTVLKSQQEAIEKAADLEAVRVIEKRVTPLKFVIGKAEDTAKLLHTIEKKAGPDVAKAVETMLTSANTVMSKSEVITREFGKSGGTGEGGSAADAIQAKATELLKAEPKLRSIEKARDEIRKRNPDLKAQEDKERAEARKAA